MFIFLPNTVHLRFVSPQFAGHLNVIVPQTVMGLAAFFCSLRILRAAYGGEGGGVHIKDA